MGAQSQEELDDSQNEYEDDQQELEDQGEGNELEEDEEDMILEPNLIAAAE